MSRSTPGRPAARPLDERYLEFHANSSAAFARYPQLEALRRFLFINLLVHRRADGWTDYAKRYWKPRVISRARQHLLAERANGAPQMKSDPPSTLTVAPVTYPFRRDAKYAVMDAISSGSPARPRSQG